ncbi:exodeoxyribonuclease VII large subunit [Clostridium ganghwense]|uniref:Exodeoxyribonuclease 7 large subunit n=1 Tax=Clostridium ganghwense TaxID=312089 RepID=A0ABT4CMM8_9CLOT|nr:exodeoxyribonuclease VII large subunit [Clostridium ganghwense]MCY6370313.1 exodeoxyribonuclease VII large subunit [Clostridium ganghwense]
MHIKTLTVSQLNSYIKKVLDNDFILRNACIKGEISNLKLHSSGHMYFSLKDEYGKINCIMFRSYASSIKFEPENGDKVIVKGRVSVYAKDGLYQFYCEEMEQDGIGDLFLAFEKLKEKLSKEGIFDENNKKKIPKYPRKIGVVTSPTGAAIRDIINVAKRRNNSVDLLIYPTLVQGEKASLSIIEAIKYLDKREDVDTIILARGGGAIEELWAFNNEELAYTIYKCSTPIVSGVGHETDFTICDFVSDLRVPTPSAAAEIAVFNLQQINDKLVDYRDILYDEMQNGISRRYDDLKSLYNNLKLHNPTTYIANQYAKLDNLKQNITYKITSKVDIEKERLSKLNSLLGAHNPLNILNKGYSLVQDTDNTVVSSAKQIKQLSEIKIIFKDGKIKANIDKVEDIK